MEQENKKERRKFNLSRGERERIKKDFNLRNKIYVEREVLTEEWYPKHASLEYEPELVEWINRINKDFRNQEGFLRFEYYCKQADYWLKQPTPNLYSLEYEQQIDYIFQEYKRCKDNTLYFANKYAMLSDGDGAADVIKYNAWKAQKIILFLFDCGYSLMIGKPRQVGFTSTMGICAVKRVNFFKNHFIKFITHTSEKGEEIFRDKIKFPFYSIPEFLKNTVSNNAEREFTVADRSDKSNLTGMNSRVLVNTPTNDAINGGSPPLVLIDEIGFIPNFSRILSQGRPTMFKFNPLTGKQEMKRQLICWGTGGYVDGGGGDAFENEFKACMDKWNEGDFGYGIIPLFFNAYSREGLTPEMFKSERDRAYAIQGREKELKRVEFHQSYPMTMDDMFLRSSKTIIPVATANEHLYKIYSLEDKLKPQYGRFEPLYNIAKPTPDGDYPYEIRGAEWHPTTGMDDPMTTAVIWRHPEQNWIHRYYQGTDPITSETGHSKMSSAIWDQLNNEVSSVVFFRGLRPKDAFLQCILQNLYYNQNGVVELIENNLGDFYLNFRENLGFKKNILPTAALHPTLRTNSGKWWGVSNKANTGEKIIQHLMELLDLYIDNIYIPWFFLQCKTFIEKDLKSGGTNLRNTRFQAADLRYDYDDVLFAVTFAYINAMSNTKYEPRELSTQVIKKKNQLKYVCGPETNFNTYLSEVNSKGRTIRRLKRM